MLHNDGVLDKKINLFGYGVNGFQNFKFALQLAKDIGIQKAGAILDDGENEREVLENLEKIFPDYCIIKWDRGDIRDKEGYCDLDTNGRPLKDAVHMPKDVYFDSKGKRKRTPVIMIVKLKRSTNTSKVKIGAWNL